MTHVHLIGIGGSGLSAIARVLLERGYTVSGSDLAPSPLFKAITEAGARTFIGHRAEQVIGADLVIRSSAIPDDNPEVVAAYHAGVPVFKRSEFLEELTLGKVTLAIAGSHGKTTTTAMLAWILEELGTNPGYIVGGMVNQLGCNARDGTGPFFVIEADEYDSMFLGLSPQIAVITNIEHDHPDCFPTMADYRDAFKAFIARVRPDGLALICTDDPAAKALMDEIQPTEISIVGYGTTPEAAYRAEQVTVVEGSPQFNLVYQPNNAESQHLRSVHLKLPGFHNVLNAVAALAVCHHLGLPMDKACDALEKFEGAGRRFDVLGQNNGITIIDDYGHHPTQVKATLEAARMRYPESKLWAIWQPHTYTRTQILESEFITALNLADQVLVLKIYAAREADPGYTAESIAAALPEDKAVYIPEFDAAIEFLTSHLEPGDVAIIFSAGDATKISQALLRGLPADPNSSKGGQRD